MNIRAIRTFLVTIFIASRLSAAPPPDSEAAKLMKGSWAVPVEQYNGTVKDGGYTFRADGTFTSFTVLPGHGQDLRVDVEGKWSIKNGILIEEVTKSSQPDIVRRGLTTRDTLLSVTQKEYRFRTEQGKERSRLRTTARALSKAASGGPQIVDAPIPKGAVHLLVHDDADAKKVFTYFPYPPFPDWYHPDESYPRPPDLGIYRLEVTPEGTVSAVTLLKSANRMMDVISMKTFVRWRAKPGPLRVVDVFISFGSRWLGPSSPMHPPD
jgi:hypothetical protein